MTALNLELRLDEFPGYGASNNLFYIDMTLLRGITIRIEAGVVKDVLIYTSIPLGDLWLLYGSPTHGFVDVISVVSDKGYLARILGESDFPELGLAVTNYAPCPTTLKNFWEAPVSLLFSPHSESRVMPMSTFSALWIYHNHLCRE